MCGRYDVVCFQDTTMLFLGGLIVAVALEETGLHTRISLCVMMAVGAQPIMYVCLNLIPVALTLVALLSDISCYCQYGSSIHTLPAHSRPVRVTPCYKHAEIEQRCGSG